MTSSTLISSTIPFSFLHQSLALLLSMTAYRFWISARPIRGHVYVACSDRLLIFSTFALYCSCHDLSWDVFGESIALKLLIYSALGILSLKFVTLAADYGVESMCFEKVGVLLLAGMTAIHPPIAFLFLCFYSFARGAVIPLHEGFPFRALQLFSVSLPVTKIFLLLGLFEKSGLAPQIPTLSLLFILFGATYFHPGKCKLSLGQTRFHWIMRNQLHYLLVNGYLWGWFGHRAPSTVVVQAKILKMLNIPSAIFVTGSQLLCCTCLFCPYWAVTLLFSVIAFHLMVFITAGLLFWEFTVFNAMMIAATLNVPVEVSHQLFSIGMGSFAWLVILKFSGQIWNPPGLGWWDTPFVQQLQWDLFGSDGQWYSLDCAEMGIWEIQFVKGPVPARPRHFITGHLGCSVRLPTMEDRRELVQRLVRTNGEASQLSPLLSQADVRENFPQLQRYLVNRLQAQARRPKTSAFHKWFRVFWVNGGNYYTGKRYPRYYGQVPISRIRIRYEEFFFNEEEIKQISDLEVSTFDISHGAPLKLNLSVENSKPVLREQDGSEVHFTDLSSLSKELL
ncbi:MAG: hypothetical protein KDD70_13920, partial [Bdellovibrionales bacterium]|nr:hypothetical protein [Bdellovibrionales bacterium]